MKQHEVDHSCAIQQSHTIETNVQLFCHRLCRSGPWLTTGLSRQARAYCKQQSSQYSRLCGVSSRGFSILELCWLRHVIRRTKCIDDSCSLCADVFVCAHFVVLAGNKAYLCLLCVCAGLVVLFVFWVSKRDMRVEDCGFYWYCEWCWW